MNSPLSLLSIFHEKKFKFGNNRKIEMYIFGSISENQTLRKHSVHCCSESYFCPFFELLSFWNLSLVNKRGIFVPIDTRLFIFFDNEKKANNAGTNSRVKISSKIKRSYICPGSMFPRWKYFSFHLWNRKLKQL